MNKNAAELIRQADLLDSAARHLESALAENEKLASEVATHRREKEAQQLAKTAADRRIIEPGTEEEFSSSILEANTDLPALRTLIEHGAPGASLGRMAKTASQLPAEGANVLDAFLVTREIPSSFQDEE